MIARTAFAMPAFAMAALLALSACDRGATPGAESAIVSEADAAGSLEACPLTVAKALCDDAELKGLHAQMKTALSKAADAVSTEGAKILADNQRAWLEAQRISCGVEKNAAALTAEQETCMQSALNERLENAVAAVEKVGPFTFQRVEINSAAKVDPGAAGAMMMAGEAPSTVTTDIDFPRIDGDSPAIQKFNALVAQAPRFKASDATEEAVKYKISYAGDDLVSVRFDMYDYTVGAAHPNTGAKAVNFNMKTLQPLKAADVFKAGSGWENFLASRAATAITKEVKAQDDSYPVIPASQLRDAVADPTNWAITDTALVLVFSEEAMGSHALGQHETSIPWADLTRFLNPAAPAPIGKS